MKSSVTYSVVSRKNPNEPELPAKFYAQAQARGESDIRTLSDRIELMCTVTRADIMAVLVALEETVKDALANGEIVRLGELGALQMSLSSKGAASKEEFYPNMILRSRILFRPGETLKDMQKTLRFERVETLPKGKKKGEGEGEDGPADAGAESGKGPDEAGTQDSGEVQP